MNKLMLLLSTLFFTSLSLAAGQYTQTSTISQLEEYGSGIRVHGLDLSINPAKCTKTSMAFPYPDHQVTPDIKKDRYNSMLLAAFVAGQKVQIKLHATKCVENNPVYYAVKLVK